MAIANQKNYVSHYTCGFHHMESFKAKHPGVNTGKGWINIKDKADFPAADIKQVACHAIKHPK